MKAQATASPAEPNYARLRYVTENFQSLQGLNWVAVGSVFFLSSIDDRLLPSWVVLLLGFALIFVTSRYIPEYYQRRFGSVEPRSPSNKHAVNFLLVLLVLGLFGGRPLGRYLDSVILQVNNQIHVMISDPDHKTNLFPVICWTLLLCTRVLRRPRHASGPDVPFYIVCLLFWAVALVFYPLTHPDVTKVMVWKVLNAGWLGISMIVIGLYDHLTLVSLLPRRVRDSVNE